MLYTKYLLHRYFSNLPECVSLHLQHCFKLIYVLIHGPPPLQCCKNTYYIEIIWIFNSEIAWLLLGTTVTTKATLALIKYKFDSLGLLNISPCPIISIAQGHLITVSLILMKLIVSIQNKISMVHNTAYMHIRSTKASNEAPFPTKLIALQYAYHTPKLCH